MMTPVTVPAAFVPPGLLVPERHAFRLTPGERRILGKRGANRMRCSEWCEKYRILSESALPGPWRNEVTPYLAGIMDAVWHPSVRKVIVCKSPQVGMTEAMHNCVGFAMDHDPGPALYVYPDEITSRENAKGRVLPMIAASPRLAGYMTRAQDDEGSLCIRLAHMTIWMAWAGSASRLGNKPIKFLLLDEVDKYPATAGKKEADPVSLAEKRTITYQWSRKVLMTSTPTVEHGPVWKALNTEAQAVFHYHVRCPSCGAGQIMNFDQIRIPADKREPEEIESGRLAWYECAHCDAHWDDAARNKAVRLGQWRDIGTGAELSAYLAERNPHKIGFHLPSWVSQFVSLSEVMAAFLRAEKDKLKLRDFMNNHKAEPWYDYHVERDEEKLLRLSRDARCLPAGVVPSGGVVAGILATADTQDNGWPFEIRAWGWGETGQSWGLRKGFVTTMADLHQVFFDEPLRDAEGNEYPVELAVIDAQGHRWKEVIDFCRERRGRTFPYQGVPRMSKPYDFSNQEFYPTRGGKKLPIPGGAVLLRANANLYKSRLSTVLEIAPADPGAWLCNTEEYDPAWAREMCAEYFDEKTQLWTCPEHKPNHFWDVSYMQLVAYDVARIRFRRKPGEEEPRRRAHRKPEKTERNERW